MRVDCTQCGKVINIPPEKVPSRPFAFACPACQHRLKVEPPGYTPPPTADVSLAEVADAVATTLTSTAEDRGDETRPVLSQSAAQAAVDSQTSSLSDPTPRAPLPLKNHEKELMASVPPLAFIVELGTATGDDLDADLEAQGIDEIRRFQDLDEAVQQLLETDVGILIIAVPKAAAPPFAPLEPLSKIPSRMRRQIFVVLMAGNVTSLDGQVAFFLQVNCLINTNEADRRRGYLQRAMLYHLKLYQHWQLDAS